MVSQAFGDCAREGAVDEILGIKLSLDEAPAEVEVDRARSSLVTLSSIGAMRTFARASQCSGTLAGIFINLPHVSA